MVILFTMHVCFKLSGVFGWDSSPSLVTLLLFLCARSQSCVGTALPPHKVGSLSSKLFLTEISKKEKNLRKMLEGMPKKQAPRFSVRKRERHQLFRCWVQPWEALGALLGGLLEQLISVTLTSGQNLHILFAFRVSLPHQIPSLVIPGRKSKRGIFYVWIESLNIYRYTNMCIIFMVCLLHSDIANVLPLIQD